ncbi:chorismate mutase [candidate division KSB1 bacterium]
MDIEDWRKRIDKIDSEILKLLNERIMCVINIAAIKKQEGIPVYIAEREEKIIEQLFKENDGPIEQVNIRNIFSMIFTESRRVQEKHFNQT